ncbi:hypothetical protein B0J14DRAFT_642051 [Halenospora varia]|nr:hypothetical protein B0J14DRAFT_642051 [Halenospora varia]
MASPATTYIATPNSFPARSNVAPSPPVSASPASFDLERGRLAMLERSGLTGPELSIIVPRDHLEIEIQEEEFPPGDARAMSPRRNSADVERLVQEARQALKDRDSSIVTHCPGRANRRFETGPRKTRERKQVPERLYWQSYKDNVEEQTVIDAGIVQGTDISKRMGGFNPSSDKTHR